MTNLKRTLIELHELEHLDLKTTQIDGKRFYTDGNESFHYPSVTTVTGLLNREHIKLWRERVGEEEANRISTGAAKRGTSFHELVEDYLRQEKAEITFTDIIEENRFNGMQPLLDDIVPIALEAPMFSNKLQMAGRVDCVGIFEDALSIIDFKTSSSYKEDYMAKPWFLQMTAYAIMVEELTGTPIEEVTALVSLENGSFQIFTANPLDYVEELYKLREQYRNLHGV
jgi:hypothetical protein|tara:strand:+ start:1087 stop:1767 length:681 start_codon:yes stop_codon:yes gene_type:complete